MISEYKTVYLNINEHIHIHFSPLKTTGLFFISFPPLSAIDLYKELSREIYPKKYFLNCGTIVYKEEPPVLAHSHKQMTLLSTYTT